MYWNPDRPKHAEGDQRFTAEIYFGPPARPDPSVRYGIDAPQAFLVEMGPQAVLRTHFHPVDQFQVFVSGSGQFGRHHVSAGALHYTDANTPYGPLAPHDVGLGFLTLRARTDSGASFMPESRDLLRSVRSKRDAAAPHRNHTVRDPAEAPTDNWQWHADDADGLRIGRVVLARGAGVSLPTVSGGGAYLVVLGGSLAGKISSAVSSASGSLVWLSAGTPSQLVTATGDGATLALLQYPVPSVIVG